MDQFLVNDIRIKCDQIRAKGFNEEGVNRIIRACKLGIKLSEIARYEGILELEKKAKKIDIKRITEKFLVWMIELVCDGTAPETVRDCGICKAAALNLSDYDGLILILYINAVLWIQAGRFPWTMQNLLFSICPDCIEEQLRKSGVIKAVDEDYDPIKVLCLDDTADSLLRNFMEEIKKYPESEIREHLQNTDIYDLAFVMRGLSGSERQKIFDMLSSEKREELANEVMFLRPRKIKPILEACDRVLQQWGNLPE